MKKLLLLVFVALLFVGCEETSYPSLKGRKYVNDKDYVELLYEWDIEIPDKITRETTIYVYVDPSTKLYEEKLIDCENYKRKSTLYSCRVTNESDKVIYKEVVSKDEMGTKEEITEKLKKEGYQIVE